MVEVNGTGFRERLPVRGELGNYICGRGGVDCFLGPAN